MLYLEGAQKQILCNRYERNPKARARCIAAQGTACKVCGFDFGIAFGEAFAGKIEVHHIKAISEIGEEYVVDPLRDLINLRESGIDEWKGDMSISLDGIPLENSGFGTQNMFESEISCFKIQMLIFNNCGIRK